MPGRVILILALMWSAAAGAAEVVDSAGRIVQVPDRIEHIAPAGPARLRPARSPGTRPDDRLALGRCLTPPVRSSLPRRETAANPPPDRAGGRHGGDQGAAPGPDPRLRHRIAALRGTGTGDAGTHRHPDAAARWCAGQDPARPSAASVPSCTARTAPRPWPGSPRRCCPCRVSTAHPRVLYARGADGLTVAAPGTDVTAVFTRLGWQVLAPDGEGTFRTSSIEAIQALDPDVLIFSDPAMRDTLVIPMPGGRCGRCGTGTPWCLRRCRSAGWRNRPRSTV